MNVGSTIQCQPDPAAPPIMLLNAFDVDPGAAERTLEIQCGELFELSISADLLVVSAWQGVYEPVPRTLVERLEQACGLRLGLLPRALDLTLSEHPELHAHPKAAVAALDDLCQSVPTESVRETSRKHYIYR